MSGTSHIHPPACACCATCCGRRFDRRGFLHLTAGVGLLTAFPSLAFAAEGNYEAMLLTCIDPRFPEPTIDYMKGRKMLGKYSQFTFAGASIRRRRARPLRTGRQRSGRTSPPRWSCITSRR